MTIANRSSTNTALEPGSYRPEIDGLRAVAIVPVVAYHTNPAWIPGGFLGVDVFFVISGYLITRVIVAELDRGQFSLLGFWERRARRLLPAALLMSLTCWALGAFLLLPSEFLQLGQEMLSHSLFVSNFFFWQSLGGYFDAEADYRPLLHTWSLSVEEQFYVLVAPLVATVFARSGHNGIRKAIWIIVGASLCAAGAMRWIDNSAAFFLLPARAWELGVGALLAMRVPRTGRAANGVLSLFGMAMLLAAYLIPPIGRTPNASTLFATAGTALVISNAVTPGAVTTMLRARPIVAVGLVSYALYLWHWPALAFLRILTAGPADPISIAGALTLGLCAALASYHLVENPIRRRDVLPRRPQFIAAVALATCVTILLAFATVAAGGFPGRWSDEALRLSAGANDKFSTSEQRAACRSKTPEEIRANGLCAFGSAGRTEFGPVLVWGDSHVESVMSVFDAWAKDARILGRQATRPGCSPNVTSAKRGGCSAFNQAVMDYIYQERPSDVVLVAKWELSSGDPLSRLDLARRVQQVSNLGARVWLVRQVPNPGFEVPLHLARSRDFGWRPPEFTAERYWSTTRKKEEDVIRDAIPLLAGLLDPMPFLCSSDRCLLELRGKPTYFDDNHLSSSGALVLREMLQPITEAIRGSDHQ